MKKKLAVLVSMLFVFSSVLAGCGKTTEDPKNPQVDDLGVTENDDQVAANVEDQMTEGGYIEAQYNVRQRLGGYPIDYLDRGVTFANISAEQKYFDYLETKWVDSSWVNPDASEDDIFRKDVFLALKSGLYDRMTATIGDYTEIETEMMKVYKGIEGEADVINEKYVNIALADIAGFNGYGFTNNTNVMDTVTLGVVLDMAAIFAHDDTFNITTYADSSRVDISNAENLQNPATGNDINYAMAVALGLDTADPAQSLTDAGYSSYETDVVSTSILAYDRVVVTNAKIYASDFNASLKEDTPAVEDGNKTSDGGNSDTTPNDDHKPADNTSASGIGKKVYINGVEYTYGGTAPNGTVVDDPVFYNHPEAAIMTWDEINDKAEGVVEGADGSVTFNRDASWEQDANTRTDNYNSILKQYGTIY